jgi:ABC-type phosphate/phosphonate transport system ATPase subunit
VKIPHISSLTIKDVSPLALVPGALVIVVGPNDGGKSTFLRDIENSIRHGQDLKWLANVSWELGERTEFETFVYQQFDLDPDERFIVHRPTGTRATKAEITGFFDSKKVSQSSFLVRLLDASKRIGLADPIEAPDVTQGRAKHPYHSFFYQPELETEFSDKIQEAFRTAVRINRTGKITSG